MKDGSLKVSKVGDKVFMGRDIIHIAIWPKDGDTNFYTMVYQDGETGKPSPRIPDRRPLSRQTLSLVKSENSRSRLPANQRHGERDAQDAPRLARRPQRRARPRTRFRSHASPVSTRTSKGLPSASGRLRMSRTSKWS
jgi:topoisomerase-4 subunit A